jgi:hypothetical protein
LVTERWVRDEGTGCFVHGHRALSCGIRCRSRLMKRTGNLDVDMIWEIPSVRCCPLPAANTLSGRVAAVPSIKSIRTVRREGLMRLRTQKHTFSGSQRPTWPASKWLSRWYGRSRKPQRLPPRGESDAVGPLCAWTRERREDSPSDEDESSAVDDWNPGLSGHSGPALALTP